MINNSLSVRFCRFLLTNELLVKKHQYITTEKVSVKLVNTFDKGYIPCKVICDVKGYCGIIIEYRSHQLPGGQPHDLMKGPFFHKAK